MQHEYAVYTSKKQKWNLNLHSQPHNMHMGQVYLCLTPLVEPFGPALCTSLISDFWKKPRQYEESVGKVAGNIFQHFMLK